MKDYYNRTIDYMRISLTDQCSFACPYCKTKTSLKTLLSYEDIMKIVKIAISLGIHKYKITGGEPFMRHDALAFIKQLKHTPGVEQVTLTTNGALLSFLDISQLQEIDSLTFSLDTLDQKKYETLTKSHQFNKVIDNIKYASSLKMNIKINCVLTNDTTKEDIKNLFTFAHQYHIILRFIELMPMKNYTQCLKNKQWVMNIMKEYPIPIHPYQGKLGNGPAHYYQMGDTYIGFIEPIHGKFCKQCNRIRLTSTGFLKACLFHEDGYDLKDVKDDETLYQMMKDVIYHKPAAHQFEKKAVGRGMNEIGG